MQGIHDYIEDKSPQAAAEFVTDLLHKIEKLAVTSVTGSPRDHVKKGLRGFPYRERCFYFRIIDDKMVLIRVLHGKQDVTTQEFPYNSK